MPKIAVLDSGTLGKVSMDYWSPEQSSRDKARAFLSQVREQGVCIAFTMTHVFELLRHSNPELVRDRLRFLQSIPLIAWLRPYNRSWFPGSIADLLVRELHAVVGRSAHGWSEIVRGVRLDLWETGTGSEMFVDNEHLWATMEAEAKRQHENEKYIASVARTDAGKINDVKIRDALNLPERPKEERTDYMRRFAEEMQRQLDKHGDRRLLGTTAEVAGNFAVSRLREVEAFEAMGGDPIQRLLELRKVPAELVYPETTIGQLGELAAYAEKLRILAKKITPPVNVTVKDVPPDVLPSYVVESKLSSIQRKAERVSASDIGDASIAPLVLYADGVEVDKRTFEFLGQVRRADAELANIMGPFFRSSDYMEIPGHFEQGQEKRG